MNKRKYTKNKRAEQQEKTRERIIKAAVALHEEIGPAQTSIKAMAEKAGVQRLTVYRYFPDDLSLFQACSSHWLQLNPPPDSAEWADIGDVKKRTYTTLLAFYRYYRDTEGMLGSVYRDMDKVTVLKQVMAGFETYLKQVHADLLACWKAKGKREQQLSATLGHCLKFSTWQSLKRDMKTDKQIAELVMTWIENPASKSN